MFFSSLDILVCIYKKLVCNEITIIVITQVNMGKYIIFLYDNIFSYKKDYESFSSFNYVKIETIFVLSCIH